MPSRRPVHFDHISSGKEFIRLELLPTITLKAKDYDLSSQNYHIHFEGTDEGLMLQLHTLPQTLHVKEKH